MIRRLVADGVPQRQVAQDLGIGRSTVRRALASQGPPKYERPPALTAFTPFEPLVRQLLKNRPDMPATVIAERVGWTGSITWFRDNVRALRPQHRPVDPADRLIWLPGDAAQCDLWFPPKKIPLEDGTRALLPVLVITCAYSRFILALMIPTRHTADLLLGMWELQQLAAVPRRLIWDNDCFPDTPRRTSPPVRPSACSPRCARATSPAKPAAGSRLRSSPNWSIAPRPGTATRQEPP